MPTRSRTPARDHGMEVPSASADAPIYNPESQQATGVQPTPPPLGEVLNPQWRPTTDDSLVRLLIEKLGAQAAPHPPNFQGEITEDPHKYVLECEAHFAQFSIHTSTWVKATTAQLTGPAASWWRPYHSYNFSWSEFKEKLIRKFAGPEIIANLLARLYGDKQTAKEPVEGFLLKKIALIHRLQPHLGEEEQIHILLELILPSVRTLLRHPPPSSLSELTDRAANIERDLACQNVSVHPQNKYKEAPKCNYCPGRHFHRDCPELKRRQQGNWRRPEERQPQPLASSQQPQN